MEDFGGGWERHFVENYFHEEEMSASNVNTYPPRLVIVSLDSDYVLQGMESVGNSCRSTRRFFRM